MSDGSILEDVPVENYTIIKGDIKSICRCCLAAEDLVQIYVCDTEISAEMKELLQPEYISVDRDDGLPNFVCTNCVGSLRNWHQFRKKCNESYRLLEQFRDCQVETLEETEEICLDAGVIIEDVVKVEHIFVEEEAITVVDPQDVLSDGDQPLETVPKEDKLDLEITKQTVSKQTKRNFIKRIVSEGNGKKRYDYIRQCPICGIVMKRGLKEHIMVHNDPTGRPFKCDSCDKTYCRKENLRQHRERVHLMIRYPCDVCGKAFSSKDILSVHRKLHNSHIQYKCDQCDQVFNSNKYLYKHKQKHLGIKKFVCSFCGKSFIVGEYLKDHLRIHTGERPFECKICTKKFRTMNHLRQHTRTHSNPSEIKELLCSECGLSFGSKKQLDTHLKSHAGK